MDGWPNHDYSQLQYTRIFKINLEDSSQGRY